MTRPFRRLINRSNTNTTRMNEQTAIGIIKGPPAINMGSRRRERSVSEMSGAVATADASVTTIGADVAGISKPLDGRLSWARVAEALRTSVSPVMTNAMNRNRDAEKAGFTMTFLSISQLIVSFRLNREG